MYFTFYYCISHFTIVFLITSIQPVGCDTSNVTEFPPTRTGIACGMKIFQQLIRHTHSAYAYAYPCPYPSVYYILTNLPHIEPTFCHPGQYNLIEEGICLHCSPGTFSPGGRGKEFRFDGC